jgi:hypothetical protein
MHLVDAFRLTGVQKHPELIAVTDTLHLTVIALLFRLIFFQLSSSHPVPFT